MRQHPTLKDKENIAVLPNAINQRSMERSSVGILGYVGFALPFGDITLPVEALGLPKLGPEKMLFGNSTTAPV